MTISIQKDLKERMDKVSDQVNWSAVASDAFRSKLVEIEVRRKHSVSKADVLKRLKATDVKDTADEYTDGKLAGRRWTERKATLKQLRRAVEYIDQAVRDNTPWYDVDFGGWNAPYGAADYFYQAVNPREDPDAGREFWHDVLGEDGPDRIQDSDFFLGFGDGLCEVWNEVRAEL
jgi:hypothetical protein